MISRCPSCGSQVKEDERLCGSCGWDFVAKKRIALPGKKPPAPPPDDPPAGGFSLPPARNLNENAPQAKPPPKAEPPGAGRSSPDDSPFTLPVARGKIVPEGELPSLPAARGAEPPAAPPAPKEVPPVRKEPPPVKKEPPPVKKEPPPEPEARPALFLPADEADIAPEPAPRPVPVDEYPARTPPPEEPRVPGVEAEPTPPPRPTPAKAGSAPPKTAAAPVSRRGSPVYIAAVAGAAIGTVSVLAVYLLLRQEAVPVQHPSSGNSPFVTREVPGGTVPPAPTEVPSPVVSPAPVPIAPPSLIAPVPPPAPIATPVPPPPAPVVAPAPPVAPPPPAPAPAPAPVPTPQPAPKDDSRPTASFTPTPRVTLTTPVPTAPKPAPPKKAPPRPAVEGPTWAFEGVIFDLLTARGVFAAKLSFRDPDGNVVGETSTGGGGNYRIVLPAGGPRGYSLRIIHGDYTERYIDEGDATSSLREATPEERKILMQAGVRNLPWVGVQKKAVRRDLGLVPRTPEEP